MAAEEEDQVDQILLVDEVNLQFLQDDVGEGDGGEVKLQATFPRDPTELHGVAEVEPGVEDVHIVSPLAVEDVPRDGVPGQRVDVEVRLETGLSLQELARLRREYPITSRSVKIGLPSPKRPRVKKKSRY